MINRIQLGTTDEKVSQLGLGCINFGSTTDETTSHQLIESYLELGGNYLDTANNYAFWNGGDGRESERTIGTWNKQNPMSRNQFLLATKLGARPTNGNEGFSSMEGTARSIVMEQVEKSLYSLQTDYIDLLYLHVDDYNTPQEETMEALAYVVNQGYVHHIGCSNFRTWRIERARQICKENDYPFFSAIQQRNSYLKPVMDADFDVQIAGDTELASYLNYYKDLTFFSHTTLLYGAYLKSTIELPEYDTLQNRERLQKLQGQSDVIAYVLKKVTDEYNGSVALFTSSKVKHLRSNMEHYEEQQKILC